MPERSKLLPQNSLDLGIQISEGDDMGYTTTLREQMDIYKRDQNLGLHTRRVFESLVGRVTEETVDKDGGEAVTRIVNDIVTGFGNDSFALSLSSEFLSHIISAQKIHLKLDSALAQMQENGDSGLLEELLVGVEGKIIDFTN